MISECLYIRTRTFSIFRFRISRCYTFRLKFQYLKIPTSTKNPSFKREKPIPRLSSRPHAIVIFAAIIGHDVSHHLATLLNSFLPTLVRHFPTARLARPRFQNPSCSRENRIIFLPASLHLSRRYHARLSSAFSQRRPTFLRGAAVFLPPTVYDIFASPFYYL